MELAVAIRQLFVSLGFEPGQLRSNPIGARLVHQIFTAELLHELVEGWAVGINHAHPIHIPKDEILCPLGIFRIDRCPSALFPNSNTGLKVVDQIIGHDDARVLGNLGFKMMRHGQRWPVEV